MTDRKLKNIILVEGFFTGKTDGAILLGFEMYNKFTKLLEPFLRIQKFLIFFLCELPLILRVDRNKRYGLTAHTFSRLLYDSLI